MSAEPDRGIDDFETVVASLRRWIFGLGLTSLAAMAAGGAGKPWLGGFCVGWFVCIYGLDQLAANARRVAAGAHDPGAAQTQAARTFLQRWIITIAALGLAYKAGFDPVAGALALVLLQVAVMCRSIEVLLRGEPALERETESRDGTAEERD